MPSVRTRTVSTRRAELGSFDALEREPDFDGRERRLLSPLGRQRRHRPLHADADVQDHNRREATARAKKRMKARMRAI